MKLGKLSLVAVMALGTSAYALEDIKVDGEAKLWYQTSEVSGAAATPAQLTQNYFDKTGNSMALTALKVGASAKLLQNISGAVKVTAVSTLGLENNLVGDVPTVKVKMNGTTTTVPERVSDQYWVEVANLKYAQKEFDVAAGRMALQTPLCFTESWNAVDNTFEAVVAHGYFLPDTILAAAWVGKHNGVGVLGAGRGSTVSYGGEFGNFAVSGAYAAAVINKSVPDTTLQAWYYNVPSVADAYWLQADTKVAGMVSIGAQYAGMNPDNTSTTIGTPAATANNRSTSAFSLKAGMDVAGVNLYAAYSTVDAGSIGFANVATGDKSMLYTTLGSIYMDGEIVAAPDTDAFKIGASTKMVPGVTLSASYCAAETGDNGGVTASVSSGATGTSTRNTDYSAWDVMANSSIGALGLTAIYTQYAIDGIGAGAQADKDINSLRIIASLKF